MRVQRRASMLAAGVMGLLIAVVNPSVAAAAGPDQFQDAAVSTYELQPARGVVHVTVVMTMKNKKPAKTSSRTCTQYAFDPYYGSYSYSTTCTYRTSYYYNESTRWVEQDATHLKIKANSGKASIHRLKRSGDWTKVRIKYSPLYYGNTRKLTLTYDLAGGGPRSTAERQAGYAWTDFCAAGFGSDEGEVRVVLPAGFVILPTRTMKSTVKGHSRVWTSGKLKSKPWAFYTCLRGANPDAYAPATIDATDRPTTVEAWTGDTAWRDAVTAAVTDDLPRLEAFLGPRQDAPPLIVREERAATSGGSPYRDASGTQVLGEDVLDRAAIDDALTALWFDQHDYQLGWLRSGSIRWAEVQAGVSDAPCTKPGPPPGGGDPNLGSWSVPGSSSPQSVTDMYAWRLQAACYIVASVADAIGPERMQAVLAAINDGNDAWSPASAPAKRELSILGWQDWLDIVTERGLIPAGADPDLAADLLRTYGVTFDDAQLAAHNAARDAYHAAEASAGGPVPAFVTASMASWDFAPATAALGSMHSALSTADEVESVLPGVDVDGGPVQQAVLAATSQAELDAAVALAARQKAMAVDVAEATGLLDDPRDALQELGLSGTVVPDGSGAVAAVEAIDDGTASAEADAIRSTLGGARDVGTQRAAMIGGGVGAVVLLVLVVAAFIVRRRRRASKVVA